MNKEKSTSNSKKDFEQLITNINSTTRTGNTPSDTSKYNNGNN